MGGFSIWRKRVKSRNYGGYPEVHEGNGALSKPGRVNDEGAGEPARRAKAFWQLRNGGAGVRDGACEG